MLLTLLSPDPNILPPLSHSRFGKTTRYLFSFKINNEIHLS